MSGKRKKREKRVEYKSGRLANQAGNPDTFDLPEEVLTVLPSDPFEQLDVARKITSIALASRVSKLESEASKLRQKLAEKDDFVAELRQQVAALDAALSDATDKLTQADDERESLLNENASLSNTVRKLTRDVSKLEIFRKTLMQSLQEEEENSQAGMANVVANRVPSRAHSPSRQLNGDNVAALPPVRTSSAQTQLSETGSSLSEDGGSIEKDVSKTNLSHGPLLASRGGTPRLTPPDSPQRHSASVSPTRLSKPVSPRRHSISFATSRSGFDERVAILSSIHASQHSSLSGSLDAGSQAGRSKVDGKEFFRHVRTRLSYEQFGAFLANVKDLNSHKQTREETLSKAEEIFGPESKDLYTIFEGLISRNHH